MATIPSFKNPIGGQLAYRSPGSIFFSIATNGTSYATASGGLSVDFGPLLSAASKNGIAVADIITIRGNETTGYAAVFTFSATTVWTMRLYTSGGTEISDGAKTLTVEGIIHLAGGSLQ